MYKIYRNQRFGRWGVGVFIIFLSQTGGSIAKPWIDSVADKGRIE